MLGDIRISRHHQKKVFSFLSNFPLSVCLYAVIIPIKKTLFVLKKKKKKKKTRR